MSQLDSADFFVPPYKIKMVEHIKLIPRKERLVAIKRCGYNVFLLKAEEVFIDLLTDSGTSAMSDQQWSALMLGDESYSGSKSFFDMKKSIEEITGFPFIIPCHQGRGAEHVLDSVLLKPGDVVPGNYHFDTTRAHIEHRGAVGVDCVIDEAFEPGKILPFKGNIDTKKLESVIKKHGAQKVPYILITITSNATGGQPVSMENIKEVCEVAKKHGVLLFFDAARFAENAYFIKMREEGYKKKSVADIAREMFSHADGCTMSAKKDGLVNIGGFIAVKNEELYQKLLPSEILMEGFPHYGGMSGRDMSAMAVGLKEVVNEHYLSARIGQVAYLAKRLEEIGVPVVKPAGGHAVFVDGKAFLPHISQEQFPSQALCANLYIESGIRAVEIGTVLAGRDPKTGLNVMPKLDLLRLTIPRRVYMKEHMDYIADSFKKLLEKRNQIKGLKFAFEAPILRHFQSKFEIAK